PAIMRMYQFTRSSPTSILSLHDSLPISVHQNFSAAGLKESVNQPHQGCFACTVNPKQAGNFTVVQGEADILERFHLAELFADMLNLNHGCYLPHSSFAVQPSDRGAAVEFY